MLQSLLYSISGRHKKMGVLFLKSQVLYENIKKELSFLKDVESSEEKPRGWKFSKRFIVKLNY